MFEMKKKDILALVAVSQCFIHAGHKRFNTCQRKSKRDWWHGFTLLDNAEKQGENYIFSRDLTDVDKKNPNKIKSDGDSYRQERNYKNIDWLIG